jgi:hypothetical protein
MSEIGVKVIYDIEIPTTVNIKITVLSTPWLLHQFDSVAGTAALCCCLLLISDIEMAPLIQVNG